MCHLSADETYLSQGASPGSETQLHLSFDVLQRAQARGRNLGTSAAGVDTAEADTVMAADRGFARGEPSADEDGAGDMRRVTEGRQAAQRKAPIREWRTFRVQVQRCKSAQVSGWAGVRV